MLKSILLFTLLLHFIPKNIAQCNLAGNVFIFSNYDGSAATVANRLTINVDVNIPNIKIGICSYERISVNIIGTYAANVTKVTYAGFNAMGNCHCAGVGCNATSLITGVSAGIISYNVSPAIPATLNNVNGNNNVICAYQCNTGNQGGCNLASQVVGYFMSSFGAGNVFNSHTVQYGCWAGATKALSVPGSCCLYPLPIKLVSFNAKCTDEEQTVFDWETASETNNDLFTVEGSENGIDFKEITTVKAVGNSSVSQSYTAKLETRNNQIYFRLRQTDFDGSNEYSATIFLNCDDQNLQFIYPNPAENELYIKIPMDEASEIEIIDNLGNVLLKKIVSISEANQEWTAINVKLFARGTYFVKVINRTPKTKKIVLK
jgi:hypothetical protein